MEKSESVKTRIRKDTNRKQYNASNIFDTLIRNKYIPNSDECLFLLTDADLYPKEGWTFIFGVTRASLGIVI
jgi:predicted Zn-dependent protease